LKQNGLGIIGDARLGLQQLSAALQSWQADSAWNSKAQQEAAHWRATVSAITDRRELVAHMLPYDGEVIGAVQRSSTSSVENDIVVCAAGTLPAELHKLWRTSTPGGYHVEYGYSCMGYEIAGGLGVKMARPDAEVIVMVGDGSYLMMNSEIATSVMLGKKLIIVVLDNRGYGCINRLQQAVGSAPFNNMFDDCLQSGDGAPQIDFVANARSLGALAEHVKTIPELEQSLQRARGADRTYLICIDTDAARTTSEGGCWWEVAVPEVSEREQVRAARALYEQGKQAQRTKS
jgi:3D-(3,5/4)-trihydroxycyclohexane-1,2-dione acylhydrolase (decyclizing)